jgi:proton glutamate symport protein
VKLHWQILLAILLAVVVGVLVEPHHGIGQFTFIALFDFLGTLFLNALKMIVVPLIVSSIICGVAAAGAGENLGRMGAKTISLYLISTLLAVLMGLFLVNLTKPGIIDGKPAGDQLNLSSQDQLQASLGKIEGRDAGDIADIFLRMVPTNIVEAAATDDMLGLIVFALLFGIFMLRIGAEHAQTLKSFWQGVFEVMMAITLFVMRFAPLGVFGLVAKTITTTGFAAFAPLAVFFFTVVAALVLHTFVSLALMLKVLGRVNPFLHYRAMVPAMLLGDPPGHD